MTRRNSKLGKILSVSVQGVSYYVVVRYDGDVLPDMMGNPVNCGRSIAGVPSYTPEEQIAMAEALIPLNINAAIQCTDPKLLIGSRCIVHLENDVSEFPLSVTIISDGDSRALSRRQMWEIRNTNPDAVIDDRTKKSVKANQPGVYTTMEELLEEVYDPEFHGGMVGVYGDYQDAFRTGQKDMKDLIDFSTKQDEKNITGLQGTRSLRTKDCYSPATVFTGRT